MEVKRKITALLFALLVIFFSATHYSTTGIMLEEHGYEDNKGILLTSSVNHAAHFFLQQKSLLLEYQGWKTEVSFPGFYSFYKYICLTPLHKMIRKIFVVDSCSYSPCKTVILFPFHEFS